MTEDNLLLLKNYSIYFGGTAILLAILWKVCGPCFVIEKYDIETDSYTVKFNVVTLGYLVLGLSIFYSGLILAYRAFLDNWSSFLIAICLVWPYFLILNIILYYKMTMVKKQQTKK